MKKTLAGMFLVSTLLLGACEAADNTQDEETENVENVEDAETPSPDESGADNADTDDTDADTDDLDEPEDEDLAEEEVEFLYEVNQATYTTINVIDGKEANEQVALLTYDDAPDKYALEIAELLLEKDAPAIFFVNGMYIENEEGQEALRQLHEMGFAIGNHTHTHPYLRNISEEEQTEEILKTSDLIEEIIGERPRFFRAPFGENTDHSKEIVKEDGMALMNWTYGYDYFEPYMNAEKLAEAMISGEAPEIDINYSLLQPGANLLMHDREWTKDATPAIIDGLREKGYEILDPSLIQSGTTESEDANDA